MSLNKSLSIAEQIAYDALVLKNAREYKRLVEEFSMSSDVFREEYSPLSDAQKKKMHDIKRRAETLLLEIDDVEFVKDQRCRSLALTNLEQSVMWAIKAIT